MPDGKPLPAIVYNGNIFPSAIALQTMLETTGPARYEVQSYDCQVLNPNSVVADTQDNHKAGASGKNMTLLVVISGYVKYGEPREADMRGFSETFVLVPNPAATSGARGKNIKDWLIQSQSFRLVV